MLELSAAPLDSTSYNLSVAVHANLLDEGYAPGLQPTVSATASVSPSATSSRQSNVTAAGSVSPSPTSKTNSAHLYRHTVSLALAPAVAGLFFLWS